MSSSRAEERAPIPAGAPVDRRTRSWWRLLSLVSAANVLGWALIAWLLRDSASHYVARQLALSGIFVAVCAFRSAFPRVDLERRCLVDTPLSSIFLGRSVATVAELAFATQCALLVERLAALSGHPLVRLIGLCIVPIVFLAQLACWYAVVSLNHIGHAIEELLWAAMLVLLAAGLGLAWMAGASATLDAVGIAACAGALVVMLAVDVPMYLERWRTSRRQRVRFLPLAEGVRDSWQRRQLANSWSEWRPEVPWMSLYFTAGVWLSLGFVFA